MARSYTVSLLAHLMRLIGRFIMEREDTICSSALWVLNDYLMCLLYLCAVFYELAVHRNQLKPVPAFFIYLSLTVICHSEIGPGIIWKYASYAGIEKTMSSGSKIQETDRCCFLLRARGNYPSQTVKADPSHISPRQQIE